MPDDGKKEIKVDISFSPLKEMDKPIAEWLQSNKMLIKKYGPYEFKGSANLDPKKWNEKKLKDELKGIVKWGCKILSTRVNEVRKKSGNQGTVDAAGIGKLLKEYDDLKKELDDALKEKLAEIEADKGDNKKGLRDGKAAMAKMGALKIKGMFSDPAEMILNGLPSGGTEDAKEMAEFAKASSAAKSDFSKDAKDAEAAISYLLKKADEISRNDKAAPALQGFGELVGNYERTFKNFLSNVEKFEKGLDLADKKSSGKSLSPADAAALKKVFDQLGNLDGAADEVMVAAKKLKPEFDAVAKHL